MKLRNKKTGDIVTLDSDHDGSLADFGGKILVETNGKEFSYDTLAELCEEWEDYKPAEPLKDNKMRQCLKLWSEINGFKGELTYAEGEDWCSFYEGEKEEELVFRNRICPNLKNYEAYTIAELYGEEDE